MNVIIGLCHSFNRKLLPFKSLFLLVKKAFEDVTSPSSGCYWQLPRSSRLCDRSSDIPKTKPLIYKNVGWCTKSHAHNTNICTWGKPAEPLQPEWKTTPATTPNLQQCGTIVVNMAMSSVKNNVEVLARKEGWFKRKVREAIKIKTLQPTINRDQGFDLPAIYSEILPVSVTRDRSRQTSGHTA